MSARPAPGRASDPRAPILPSVNWGPCRATIVQRAWGAAVGTPENRANVNAVAATHSARSSGQPVTRLGSKVTIQSPGTPPGRGAPGCDPVILECAALAVESGHATTTSHRRPRLIACNNVMP
jgi:hypothetical protein